MLLLLVLFLLLSPLKYHCINKHNKEGVFTSNYRDIHKRFCVKYPVYLYVIYVYTLQYHFTTFKRNKKILIKQVLNKQKKTL